jgi:hypothetical protein
MQVGIVTTCILDFRKSANNTLCSFAKIMLLFSNHNVRNRSTLLKPYHNSRVILVFLACIYQTNGCKYNFYFETHAEAFSIKIETNIPPKSRLR